MEVLHEQGKKEQLQDLVKKEIFFAKDLSNDKNEALMKRTIDNMRERSFAEETIFEEAEMSKKDLYLKLQNHFEAEEGIAEELFPYFPKKVLEEGELPPREVLEKALEEGDGELIEKAFEELAPLERAELLEESAVLRKTLEEHPDVKKFVEEQEEEAERLRKEQLEREEEERERREELKKKEEAEDKKAEELKKKQLEKEAEARRKAEEAKLKEAEKDPEPKEEPATVDPKQPVGSDGEVTGDRPVYRGVHTPEEDL